MLTDKNGKTFEVNQVVEISNAWGTTDNGLWVIESCGDTGLCQRLWGTFPTALGTHASNVNVSSC